MRFNQRILRLALATSSLGLRVNCHVGAVQPDIESVLAAPEVPVQPKRQKGHSLFWDFTSLNITQKIKLLEHVKSFGEAQCHIDWDLLKDRYHVATLQSARRLGKRPPRARRKRRRKRMNDWKVQDTVKSKLNIKQTAEEKMDETINTLNSLIEDALDNAGFADIEEQLKEAEIRVQKKQEAAATEAPSAGDTEPASDDDAMVETEAPVAADDVPAVGDDASATGDDTTSSKDDDTSTKDDDAPAAGDDESSGIDDDAEPTGDNEAAVTAPPSTADDASSTGDDTPPASDDKPANEDDAVATGVGTSTDDKPASTKAPTSDGGDGDALPNEDSVIIPNYVYNRGNCPDAGDSDAEVPCAPDNLDALCDKYQEGSSFTLCWQACIPSFCCIHDAPAATNLVAPSCNEDVNCAQYASCYIVWWKLHDTVGPATQLQMEQNADDFFDLTAEELQSDVTGVTFFREMLFHHFDDSAEIIRLGTVQVNETFSFFDSDQIFLNSTYWNTTL